MAGLQYKFFPTDFLYPRPSSSSDVPNNIVVSVVPPKPDDLTAKPKGPKSLTNNKAGVVVVVEPIVISRNIPKSSNF
ncbi:hypothetical protein E6C27_scaffold280G00510 [Cucumis melo var. makuwa]|uniref:Uncharacterized protein n=2 Tax=Cucumis melo TaxID=3656 RepID=A0A5A7URF0_CUCMM|nr:hypothetical protein E6C27_scaffold280G00510 [Cucumis melo var. makuwa]